MMEDCERPHNMLAPPRGNSTAHAARERVVRERRISTFVSWAAGFQRRMLPLLWHSRASIVGRARSFVSLGSRI